ncbi:hypothetical protein Fmac_033024 [Flemingia macrophylla]|uniref:Uncharacterized protein n=1 Tax=Flemingia macrophylla TaxID=520843 RepID=A0ABD1L707_9FABA
MEPFPSSTFKVLILIFATTTKICTDERSARARAPGFAATVVPSYSSGRIVTHSLADFDFHDHRPAVLIDQHPLLGVGRGRCAPDDIVHHLSGPDRYALTRTLHRRSGSVDGATHKGIPPISFLAPYGFTRPLTRIHVRLLGPCFKTGRMGSPQADARSAQVSRHAVPTRAALHNRDDDVSASISTARAWATVTIRIGQCPEPIGGPAFTYFSLGQNLPPDWGCIPKQPDSPTAPRGATAFAHDGALTLSGAPFQGPWARSATEDASPDYNSDAKSDRFSWWALPGSLAVTNGILVSFFSSAY